MYGLSIQIGKGLWTRIWIQKFKIVVYWKISILFQIVVRSFQLAKYYSNMKWSVYMGDHGLGPFQD